VESVGRHREDRLTTLPSRDRSYDVPGTKLDFDAVVIGAGVCGLYQLYRLRQLGLRVRAFDDASGVGGTWFWNRYPGARFDSESWSYSYSFSPEILKDWDWSENFAGQPEIERYLNFVADKLDLRRDIRFDSHVQSAHYQEDTRSWRVTLDDGQSFTARFLVTAIGVLSAPTLPRIEGIERFKGEAHHPARWPDAPISFEGKRVAVIGTGSTGVQIIQEAAKTAAQLTVYQRTPNWCAPLHNSKISIEEMEAIRARYPEIMARCQETPGCFIHGPDPRSVFDVTAEEREAFFEKRYSEPGFGIWHGNFRDVLTDKDANAFMSDFMARKIRERVKDPVTAEKLIPKNHGFGTRRVPLETRYYEVYNQPNVTLIDVNETPIERITPKGIKSSDGERPFDIIVYASGFDAIAGPFDRIDFRGIGGQRLKDVWSNGPQTFLGVLVTGFPNLMMVMGPHGGLGNFTRFAEYNADWVTDLIAYARQRGSTRIEATPAGTMRWTDHVMEMSKILLSNQIDSWMTGVNKNVEGKSVRKVMRYGGGFPQYKEQCDAVAAATYNELSFS